MGWACNWVQAILLVYPRQVKAQMQEQGLLRQIGALRLPVLDATGLWDVA